MKQALFIIAFEGFQDQEFGIPYGALQEAGVHCSVASNSLGMAKGKFGKEVHVNLLLMDVNVTDYDAIVFIGGPGAYAYQQDKQAHRIAQEAMEQNKILAAICIAPTILAYAGVLENKEATVWNGDEEQEEILHEHGAISKVDELVVVSGNIITANGPGAAEEFGRVVLEKLL